MLCIENRSGAMSPVLFSVCRATSTAEREIQPAKHSKLASPRVRAVVMVRASSISQRLHHIPCVSTGCIARLMLAHMYFVHRAPCVLIHNSPRTGIAYASGSAATATIVNLFKSGDHIISIDDVYGGTQRFFR